MSTRFKWTNAPGSGYALNNPSGTPTVVAMAPGTRNFLASMGIQGDELSNGTFVLTNRYFKEKPERKVTLFRYTKAGETTPLYEVSEWLDGHCTNHRWPAELLPFHEAAQAARDIFQAAEATFRLTGKWP